MNESGMKKLHTLLFDGEGELVNVKFFPGSGRGLTRDQLADAGADMISAAREAWKNGMPSNPPKTGVEKTPLMG